MAFNLFPQTDFRQMDLNYVLDVSKQAAANLEEYAADKEQVVATQAAAEEALAAAQQDIETATQAATSASQDAQTASAAAGTATQAAESAEQDAQTASAAAQTAQRVQESIPADYTQLSNDVVALKSDLNGTSYLTANFFQGGMSADGVPNTAQKFRVTTDTFITYDRDIVLKPNTGFRFILYFFENGVFSTSSGWQITPYFVSKNSVFRVLIGRVTEDTSETANVSLFVKQISFVSSVYAIIDEMKLTDGQYTPFNKKAVTWRIGGLDGNGADTSFTTRANVVEWVTVQKNDNIIFNTAGGIYGYSVYYFSTTKTKLNTASYIYSNSVIAIPENVAFVRIAARKADNSTITDADLELISSNFAIYGKDKNVLKRKKYTPVRKDDIPLGNDGTVIGDNLWLFKDSAISNVVQIMNAKTGSLVGSKTHNFGHCNSVDYNQLCDCLVVYKTNTSNECGCYIFKDPQGVDFLDVNSAACLTIPFYNNSTYLNPTASVCWGEDVNILYVMGGYYSDNSGSRVKAENIPIYKIELGMGTNDLSSDFGTFIPGKANDEYNGTCKVVKTYSGTVVDGIDVLLHGSSAIGTAQGMTYDGYIYIGWGSSGHNFIKVELDDNTNRYNVVENYYNEVLYNGEYLYLEPELVALYNDSIICGSTGATNTLYAFRL